MERQISNNDLKALARLIYHERPNPSWCSEAEYQLDDWKSITLHNFDLDTWYEDWGEGYVEFKMSCSIGYAELKDVDDETEEEFTIEFTPSDVEKLENYINS